VLHEGVHELQCSYATLVKNLNEFSGLNVTAMPRKLRNGV